jgi:hypothetical protein
MNFNITYQSIFGKVSYANNTLFISFNICKVDFKKLPQVAKRTSTKRAKKDKLFMTKCTCKVFERKLMRMKGTCVNDIYMKILSICLLILLYLKSYF